MSKTLQQLKQQRTVLNQQIAQLEAEEAENQEALNTSLVVTMYEAGKTIDEICLSTGFCNAKVYRVLNTAGVDKRRGRIKLDHSMLIGAESKKAFYLPRIKEHIDWVNLLKLKRDWGLTQAEVMKADETLRKMGYTLHPWTTALTEVERKLATVKKYRKLFPVVWFLKRVGRETPDVTYMYKVTPEEHYLLLADTDATLDIIGAHLNILDDRVNYWRWSANISWPESCLICLTSKEKTVFLGQGEDMKSVAAFLGRRTIEAVINEIRSGMKTKEGE